MNRDISRSDLKDFLEPYFIRSDKNLKRMSQALNLLEPEYSRFVSALHKYDIHPRQR
ncbi:MAG: hypothetical protein GY757_03785 [bacterium]|nr:hypothetical protein [bacterium]